MDWFLYNRDLYHERVKGFFTKVIFHGKLLLLRSEGASNY